jgi:DNA-binding GntR family transcriptional regulator
MAELKSLRRRNLRDDAIDVLRAAILGGELAPGSIHSAVSLADRLGVSPTPVREAMLALVSSGLVEVVPNRGFRVTVVEDRDLDEIFELRLILEVAGLELAVERAATADLAPLTARLAELEAAAASSDVAAYLVADRAFHLELLALGGNERLVRIVAELRDQARITGLRTLAEAETLAVTAAEHRPLLEAVRARDLAAAQRIMTGHLGHTRAEWAGRTG